MVHSPLPCPRFGAVSCASGEGKPGTRPVNPLPVPPADASIGATKEETSMGDGGMQDGGWPVPEAPGFLAAWQAAAEADGLLRRWGRHAAVRFALESGGEVA